MTDEISVIIKECLKIVEQLLKDNPKQVD